MLDVRKALTDALRRERKTMKWLSTQLGRNHAYIQQFIERNIPADLDLETKLRISELLKIPLADLGVTGVTGVEVVTKPKPLQISVPDLERYTPPADHPIFKHRPPNVAYWIVKTQSLECHPLAIKVGDIIAFDLTERPLADVPEGIVLVQCADRAEGAKPRVIIRQFVRPSLVTTNATRSNECFNLHDESLPFRATILGVYLHLVR